MKKVVLNTKRKSSTIRLNYSNGEAGQRMREAIIEHERSPHKSIVQLAGEFDIGWKSLNDRLKGNILLNASVGKRPYLNKEEEGHLVRFLMEMADLGFGYSPKRLRYLLLNMLSKDPNIFTQGWYQSFMRRHPELSIRRAEALDRLRAASANSTLLDHYFQTLQLAFNKCRDLSEQEELKPHRIFVMDEVGFSPFLTKGYVIARKGVRSVQSLVSNNRQHLTLAAFANANGQAGKPFLIVPKSSSKEILNGHFQGSPVFSSESGYMNDHLYKAWCQFFVSEIKEMRGDASKWCLLIVDGLNSHTMSSEALDILNDANVLSLSLPSHSSAMLQVHDVAIFGPLKRYFDHKMAEHVLKKGPNVTLKQLASIIEEPYERANSSFNIRAGFKKVGIYPLNTNWVSENSEKMPMLKVKGKEDRFIYLTQKATSEDTMLDLLNSLRHLDLALTSYHLKGHKNHGK